MIVITRPADPFSLNQRNRANTVRQEHCDEYNTDSLGYQSRAKNRKRLPIDDSIYKAGGATKKALIGAIYADGAIYTTEEKQHGKCYFCEYPLSHGGLHVEHYRPKKSFKKSRGGEENYPGYYWLAYSWDNLILACYDCNLTKGTIFPLDDEDGRVYSHSGDVNLHLEIPLLLDPTLEDPRNHIRFLDDMPIVFNGSKKATATIRLLKLDGGKNGNERSFLRVAREKYLKKELLYRRSLWEKITKDYPADTEMQLLADEARDYLEKARRPGAPFSSMAQDFLSDWVP